MNKVERLASTLHDADWAHEHTELIKALDWAPKSLVQGRDVEQVARIRAGRKAAWHNWKQQPKCYEQLAQVTADRTYFRLAELGDPEALYAWLVHGCYPSFDCYERLIAHGYEEAARLWCKYHLFA